MQTFQSRTGNKIQNWTGNDFSNPICSNSLKWTGNDFGSPNGGKTHNWTGSEFRNWTVTVIWLAVLLLISACGQDNRLQPLSESAVILAFGDSLTKGKGVTTADSYPSVLAELTGRTVINAGISGEVSATGLARLTGVITDTAPSLLLLMHGGNDILQNRSQSALEANLRKMIQIAQTQDVQVVLIGIPEKTLFSSTAALYEKLAKEFGLVFEDSIIASLIKKPTMKSDSVHFNQAGYRAMAVRLDEVLRKSGAL